MLESWLFRAYKLLKMENELQFTTNHLSHFLLFHLLKPALLAAASPEFESRVIILASSGHRRNGLNDSDNYNFQKGCYNPWEAYAQSKTANIYTAIEIDRRYSRYGLRAASVHPGAIRTQLNRHLLPEDLQKLREDSGPSLMKIAKSPEQGAATTTWAAVMKDFSVIGGKYLADCSVAKNGPDDGDMMRADCVTHTYNAREAARLWNDSLKICQIDDVGED